MRCPAAECQQAGVGQSLVVDDDAWTQAERAEAASRLGCDDATNLKRNVADQDLIADPETELREQFRTDDDAVILQQVVRVGAGGERQRAVEGKRLLYGAKLHH